jgi:hypothetical protein
VSVAGVAAVAVLLIALSIVNLFLLPYLCWQKGKQIAAFVGFFVPFMHLWCACGYAKPGSPWYETRYPVGSLKRRMADLLFPEEVERRRELDALAAAYYPQAS